MLQSCTALGNSKKLYFALNTNSNLQNILFVSTDVGKSNVCESGSACTSLSLMIRNTSIEKVYSFKLLGAILDEHLSWKNHVILLKKKLLAILAAVIKIRPCFSKNALLMIYHSLIMSQIRYCIANWCFGNVIWIKKLQKICNQF